MNFDRNYFNFEEYEDEYNFTPDGVTLKPTASKEAIKALLVYRLHNVEKDKIAEHLIIKFKETDCYKSKSEEEREEIINFLKEETIIEDDDLKFFDEKGNEINV